MGAALAIFIFCSEDGKLQQSQERADYQFDPRTRPWYALARDTRAPPSCPIPTALPPHSAWASP
jgi:hypothetical protein